MSIIHCAAISFVVVVLFAMSCVIADDAGPATKQMYLKLRSEADAVLAKHILGVWFPRCVDNDHGGFVSEFTREWKPAPSQGKFSVFQGRMTWVAAQVAMRRPELKEQFLPIARHGLQYLNGVMWDKQAGGFYWGLDDEGKISPRFTDGKELYGMSFCLYGAAAVYQATKDPAALKLATDAFTWIDQHAHDEASSGYHEWLTRDGKIVTGDGKVPVAAFPIGNKSMNTHIHLLEAFTQLYQVWPDPHLKQRVEEMISVIRDRVCVEQGALNLYFTNDWKPTSNRDSYGHDVETAFLLLEASEAIGSRPDEDAKTNRMAKMLVDHALASGWDEQFGGFYREGEMLGKPDDLGKEWWTQFEALNALLLMHDLYGRDNPRYFQAFQKQWRFIRDHQIDHEFGGVFANVERDGTVKDLSKAQIWKAAYHDGRAMLNVIDRLGKLAGELNNEPAK